MNVANPKDFNLKDPIKVILQKLKETPSKIDRNLLLDLVRKTSPITIYKLHKITGFAYTSLKAIVREFEFVGLVSCRVLINENNQAYKEYFILEKDIIGGIK